MTWLKRAITVVFILCLSALSILIYESQRRGASPANDVGATAANALGQFTPLTTPRPAPAVHFTAHDGTTVALADFRGRMVLVNLWATWCGPCVKEMPSLQRLQARLGPALTILAISEDRKGAAAVDPFVARLGLNGLATYLDPQDTVSQAFDVHGLPTSFLIDRQGRILGVLEGGAAWDSPAMLGLLRPYLAPPPSSAAR